MFRRPSLPLPAALVATGLVVLLLTALAPVRGTAVAAAPTLTLSTGSGSAGASLMLSGRGFPARQAGQVTWGGSAAGMPAFRTTSDGSFSVALQVPHLTGGTYTVAASAGGATASQRYTIGAVATPTRTSSSPPLGTPTVTPTPTATPTVTPATGGRRVVAYFPIWVRNSGYAPSNIDFHTVTTVAHFSVLPAADGSITIPDWGPFPDPGLVTTAHAAGAKVILVVGTGDDPSVPAAFSKLAATDATRQRFAQNLLKLLNVNGYDGVDLDWEFPASAADRANLTALVTALRSALGGGRTISLASPANDWNGQYFDLGTLSKSVDWFGVMTYDLSGASWSSYVDHNAALYPGRSGELSLDGSLQYYLSRGVPRAKIYPGLPFFGQRFDAATTLHQEQTPPTKGASPDYKDVVALAGNGWTVQRDGKAQVPYLVRSGGAGVISYDDATSIGAKCGYIKSQSLGGAILWHLGKDQVNGAQPLLQAAATCR